MPIVHRLAARNAINNSSHAQRLINLYHGLLTSVFGDENWKQLLWNEKLTREEKEFALASEYEAKLKLYMPYSGYCPVREGSERVIKYFVFFASRHPDALLLMNDIMIKAYFQQVHQNDHAGTLFAESDWREMRDTLALAQNIVDVVTHHQGETRANIWLILAQQHFMSYLSSEYKEQVNVLVAKGKIHSPTPRKSQKRLNDSCQLFLR